MIPNTSNMQVTKQDSFLKQSHKIKQLQKQQVSTAFAPLLLTGRFSGCHKQVLPRSKHAFQYRYPSLTIVYCREKIKRLNIKTESKLTDLYCSALLPLHYYNFNVKNNWKGRDTHFSGLLLPPPLLVASQ